MTSLEPELIVRQDKPMLILVLAVIFLLPAASGQARMADFTAHEAVMDSLSQIPPRFRGDWLKGRGFGDQLEFGTGSPESTGLRLVGKYGRGPAREVTGQGSLLFLSNGSAVAVFNIADPGRPVLLTEIQARSIVSQSIVRNGLLYIGDYAELSIWDISDPTRPGRLSVIPYGMRDFALSDSLLAFTQQDTFRIYSVADPANPRELGILPDSGTVRTASGGRFILNSQQDIVYIIDCSDPARPQRRGSYPGYALGLAARGDICFAAVYWHSGQENFRFDVLDISDPDNIRRIGQLAEVGGYDIHLDGPLAFVSGYQSSGFEFTIVSIADSTRPMRVGRCATPGDNDGVWGSFTLDRAYVADRFRGLTVINTSDLNNPVIDTSMYSAGNAVDLHINGNLMYVASTGSGLHIVDITDPEVPTGLSVLDSCRRYTGTRAVVANDSFAFIEFTPSWLELRSVDVSDPTRPMTAGGVLPFNPVRALALCGNLLYAAQANRFEIFNVARPREPVLVGSCQTQDGTYFGLAVQDSFAYLTSGRLQIINIADPTAPRVVGSGGQPSAGVAVRDTFAYLSYPYDTLFVYSVANPAQPQMLSATPTGIWPWDVALNENSLFVGATYSVEVYDLSDPGRPRRTGGASVPYGVRRLHYRDGLLYAAMWDAGVAIYETTAVGITEPHARAEPSRSALRAWPNPVTRRCFLNIAQTDIREVSIRDVVGRKVALPQVLAAQMMRLDFGELPPGLYFVEAASSGQREFVKIIKR